MKSRADWGNRHGNSARCFLYSLNEINDLVRHFGSHQPQVVHGYIRSAAPHRSVRGRCRSQVSLSDDELPPQEVRRRHREAGYDLICLADH